MLLDALQLLLGLFAPACNCSPTSIREPPTAWGCEADKPGDAGLARREEGGETRQEDGQILIGRMRCRSFMMLFLAPHPVQFRILDFSVSFGCYWGSRCRLLSDKQASRIDDPHMQIN